MTTTLPPLNIPSAVTPIYEIAPKATKAQISEFLTQRLSHLKSILSLTSGESGESFRRFNTEIQDQFLHACISLAEECTALFEQTQARKS